jgi:hypothetical protein
MTLLLMLMLHVQVTAACPCRSCMSMPMLHVQVDASSLPRSALCEPILSVLPPTHSWPILYDQCVPFGGKMNVIIQMILFLPFIQMITTMSSSSQMSTTTLSPSHMITSMLSPSHMVTPMLSSIKKNDNTKCSGQCYHPAK